MKIDDYINQDKLDRESLMKIDSEDLDKLIDKLWDVREAAKAVAAYKRLR